MGHCVIKTSFIFSWLMASALLCCAQQFEWANSAGGLGVDVGRCIEALPNGGCMVGGSFGGSANFSGQWLTGRGLTDGFVARYTTNGDLLWVRNIGGHRDDAVRGMAIDEANNVYVCGTYTDTVIFVLSDTDTVAFGSAGGIDMFLAKYSPDGDFLWATTMGGPGEDLATDVVFHPEGALYVTGGFEKRCVFAGTASLLSAGGRDVFLARFDPSGFYYGASRAGGLFNDTGAGVAVASDWKVYVTGDFDEQATFGTINVQSNGSSDVFLAKYSYTTPIWVRSAGGSTSDVATSLATDLQGTVTVCGYFLGQCVFPTATLTAQGYNDVFVARYSDAGQCLWARSLGGGALDNAMGIDVTWDGQIFVTGLFDSQFIAGQDTVVGQGYDVFVTHLNGNGQHMYTQVGGAASADIGQAISVGANSELYITGYYYFFADFGPNSLPIAENGDALVAKLSAIFSVDEGRFQQQPIALAATPFGYVLRLPDARPVRWQLTDLAGRAILFSSDAELFVPFHQLPKGLSIISAQTATGFSAIKLIRP